MYIFIYVLQSMYIYYIRCTNKPNRTGGNGLYHRFLNLFKWLRWCLLLVLKGILRASRCFWSAKQTQVQGQQPPTGRHRCSWRAKTVVHSASYAFPLLLRHLLCPYACACTVSACACACVFPFQCTCACCGRSWHCLNCQFLYLIVTADTLVWLLRFAIYIPR